MKIFMTVTFIIQLTLSSLFLYYCVEYTLTPRVFGANDILTLYNI